MAEGQQAWESIHSSVSNLKDLIAACLGAFGPEAEKVSSTTKKRLAQRALAGLSRGQELVQVLGSDLQQLQQASNQREHNVLQASKSHQGLMQQLGLASDELQRSQDRLRQAEADRLAATREMELLRQHLTAATTDKQALEATVRQLESDLQAAAFGTNEASCQLSDLRAQMEQLAATTRSAEQAATAAADALAAAQQEADKEKAARQRHEDAVARLTADNLVFMAKLRAAESAAAAATAERDELVLALEEHKGPWMDEVRHGVETRVKEALSRAQQLEKQQEHTAAQHAAEVEQLKQQQADLEAALTQAKELESELRSKLTVAEAAAAEACAAAEEAQVLAAEAQAAADERAAELRVAQDSLRTMREECNERWMSERAARAELAELQSQLADLEAERDKLKSKLQARTDELMTQRAVNQQLMLKKEEVEWQLMAAIAKLNHEQQSHSGSPMSGMHSPISPHMLAPAQPPQQQQQTAAGTPAAVHTCDAVTSLLTGQMQQPGDVQQQQQQLSACDSGDTTLQSPFSTLLQQPFPDASAEKGDFAPQAAGLLACVPEIAEPQAASCTSSNVHAESPPRPSAFHTATAAAAAAATGGASRSSSDGSAATKRPSDLLAGGFPGLCVATSLPVTRAAGSAGSFPDMFSLPSLSYGLATLPPPEMLVAAASRSLGGAGTGDWGESLGLAHSMSLGLAPAGSCSSASGDGAAASSGLSVSPTGSLGGGFSKGVVVGATGGLMAPFSPLPRARSSSLPGGIGSGAVFPESLTASAVTDEEQLDVRHFSLPPNLLQQLQQFQGQKQLQPEQQALGQQVGVQQLVVPQQQQQQQQFYGEQTAHPQPPQQNLEEANSQVTAVPAPLATSAAGAVREGSGGSSATTSPARQVARKPLVHPAFAQPAGAAASPRSDPAAQSPSSTSSGSSRQDAPPHRQQQCVSSTGTSTPPGGSSTPRSSTPRSGPLLHGILLNGPHSRPRSPGPGASPCGSMKSVRFSFENLDQSLGDDSTTSPKDRMELHDQWDDSSSVECRVRHAGAAAGEAAMKQQYHGWVAPAGSYDGYCSSSVGGGTGAAHMSRFSASRAAAGSPSDMCFSIRAGHVSRSEGGCSERSSNASSYQRQLLLQQQQLQHAKQAAAARAAAMVVNMPLPKGPPVHPVFGAVMPRSAPPSTAGTPP